MITGELRKEFNAALFGIPVANSVFDKAHQNCRWNVFCDYEFESMPGNMNQNVFPFIKNELHADKDKALSRYMKDAFCLIPRLENSSQGCGHA